MNRTLSAVTLMGAVLTLFPSCDSDSEEPTPSGTGDSGTVDGGDSGRSKDELFIGTFSVDMTAPREDTKAFALLIGRVYDGPVPPTLPSKLADEAAGCQLLVPTHPFCDPACGGEAACTDESVCTRYPKAQDLGTLQVMGLGDAFTVKPASGSFVYQSPTLPFPPCEAGADVEIRADRFTLQGKCIAPLELTTPDPIEVKMGRAVKLEWTPPPQPNTTRIEIALDISHHGGAKGEIVCDVPDTGLLEIPERLVSQLVALGVAGFPDIRVARISKTSAKELPHVTLTVSSAVQRIVDIGLTSCFSDNDCADEGTRCDTDLSICK